MSKHLTILPALAALLLSTACSNDDMDGVLANGPVAAQVTADISNGQTATRISINGTTESFEAGDVINVAAGGAASYEYTKQSDGTWEASNPYYFQDHEDVTFRGWYAVPELTVEDNTISISISTDEQETNDDGWNQWDILATPEVTTNVSSPTVSFTGTNAFEHIMSQATFSFEAGEGVSDLSALTGYALKSLTTDATFNTLTCELEAGTTTGDIGQEVSVTSGTEVECDPIILVPQTVTDNLILEVTYNSQTYYAELALPSASAGALQAGIHYAFSVTIDNSGLVVNSAEIKDWDTPTTDDADASLYTGPFYVSDAESLAKYVAISGAQIIVTDNIELSSPLSVTGIGVTIDLNGNTISGNYKIEVGSSASLTISDGSEGATGAVDSPIDVTGGELTINGGTFSSISCSGGTIAISDGTFHSDISSLECVTIADGYQCVKIDDTPTYVIVSSSIYDEADLIAAAKNGGTYTMMADITLTSDLSVTASDLTIDLNGYSINYYTCTIYTESGASLTISDGSAGATGTVDCGVYAGSGTITISSGTFTSTVSRGSGTIEISGGTFYTYDPVEAGHCTIANGYVCIKTADSPVTYEVVSLAEAVTMNGTKITLTEDTTLSSDLSVTASGVTLDLNGYYIWGSYKINVENGARLTIIEGRTGHSEIRGDVYVNEGGDLTLSGGDFSSITCSGGTITIEDGTISRLYCNSGNITISGGTFDSLVNCYSGGTITISGGTFNTSVSSSGYGSITIYGGTFNKNLSCNDASTITIYGGTFYNDPSSYVPDGYTVTANADGYYVVGQQ